MRFCVLSYTILDCLLENPVSQVVSLTSHHLEMGSYPLKPLIPVYYFIIFSCLFFTFLIFDHLFGLNNVHYYGLSENVEFCFFLLLFQSQIAHPLLPLLLLTTEKEMTPTNFSKIPCTLITYDQLISKMQSTLQ